MRILLTGSTGLLGHALRADLTAGGHTVIPLVRRRADVGEMEWDPGRGMFDASSLGEIDAAVNLAGESIASRRWSPAQKQEITASRVQAAQLLASTLAGLPVKPRVLISASATGFYGDRGNEVLTESSQAGHGFLPAVCSAWEFATQSAVKAGIRTVCIRTGVVLSSQGGALPRMLTPFRLGLGGNIGSGRQWMSWISVTDYCGIVRFILEGDNMSGPVNVVSPQPVTNAQFTQALARALERPAAIPLPAIVARMLLGEMANELLLASQRVMPDKVLASGYAYRQPDIGHALRSVLARRL